MSGDTDNPRIWAGADVFVADPDTTAPTDIDGDLDAAFVALGLLSEDGMTESESVDANPLYAWGGIHYRTTRSKHAMSFTVTALEDNPAVFDLRSPGSEAEDVGSGVTHRTHKVPSSSNIKAVVLELFDGEVTSRRYIPRCEVVEPPSEVKSADSEPTMYELKFEIYSGADGVRFHEWTDNPAAVPTGS